MLVDCQAVFGWVPALTPAYPRPSVDGVVDRDHESCRSCVVGGLRIRSPYARLSFEDPPDVTLDAC